MKKQLFVALSAAIAMSMPAYAQVGNGYAEADVFLAGEVPAVCQISFGALPGITSVNAVLDGGYTYDSASIDLDMTAGRTTNQEVGTLSHRCNAPYTLTVQSEYGGLCNTSTGEDCSTLANNSFARQPYGINFDNPTAQGGTGFEQHQIFASRNTPLVVESYGWGNIASLSEAREVNIELDLWSGFNSFALAGEYEDTLTFVIETSL